MFDNITFISENYGFPVSTLSSDYEDEYTKNARYVFQGVFNTLYPFPLTEYALANYYMDVFSLIDAGRQYYTKRSKLKSYLLLYTYSGQGLLEYQGKKYSLTKNEGIFIDCKEPHIYRATDNHWLHSVLHINGIQTKEMYEKFKSLGSVLFSDPINGMYQQYLEALIACCSSSAVYRDLEASTLICNILTHLILSTARDADNRAIPRTIQDIINYIDNNYTSDISLDFLSSHFGISKYYMSREFKRYTGFSPHDYIIQKRLSTARISLVQTKLPVNVIAESVGITNVCNFNNLFRKKIGMSPGEYRKKRQTGNFLL